MIESRARRAEPPVTRWEQYLARAVFACGRVAHGRDGGRRARGILRIFSLVERLLERGHDIRSLRPDSVLRYEIASLPARPLPLAAQPLVTRGSRVVVIHFNNRAISAKSRELTRTHALTWWLTREATEDLRVLAALYDGGALPPGVCVVWAEGLYARTLARYGFSIRAAPRTLRTSFARLFMLSLVAIYRRDGLGLDHIQQRRLLRLPMGEAWISLDELRLPASRRPGS